MVECLSEQKGTKPVMALCAPFYLSHYYEKRGSTSYTNVVDFIEKLKKDSEGMLLGFESVVPSYAKDKNLNLQQINEFNKYVLDQTGLYEVGGTFDKLWGRGSRFLF